MFFFKRLFFIVFIGFFMSGFVMASPFECSFRLIKSTCWKDKEVTLQVINSENLQVETQHILAADKEVLEAPIDCNKIKRLTFKASVNPPVWESDKGNFYRARRMWNVPTALSRGADNWLIDLCFSRDFAGVPLPLVDFTQCKCEFPEREGHIIQSVNLP